MSDLSNIQNLPKVSIAVPCLNEEKFIGKVIENILGQDYPLSKIEAFICDGGSTDKTRDIIVKYSKQYPQIQLLDNPDRFVPHAFNRALKVASGKFIFIFGAHAAYPADYITTLVETAEQHEAALTGAALETVPRNDSLAAIAIAQILSHPFGVGNASFRTGTNKITEVDTVPFGCYRKSIFDQAGPFDERLIRNQDMEMSKRIIHHGGKVLLVPGLKSQYFPRGNFKAFWKNNFGNGQWVILTAYYTKQLKSLSVRHFIPLGFFLYVLALPLLYFFSKKFLIPILVYSILLIYSSLQICFREGNFKLLPYLIYGFFILHFSNGLGSFVGIFKKK